MNTLHSWLSSGSVTAVVSGLVAWLVAHRTGLAALARNLAKAAAGGSVTVQQVAAAAEQADPAEVEQLRQKVSELSAAYLQKMNDVEAEVQRRLTAELQKMLAAHSQAVAVPIGTANVAVGNTKLVSMPTVDVSHVFPDNGAGVDEVDVSHLFNPPA